MSQSPFEKFVECLDFIVEHDLPSPDKSEGNLVVLDTRDNGKMLMRVRSDDMEPTDAYTINQQQFGNELTERRKIALELLTSEEVRLAIMQVGNWEIGIADLKEALKTCDYDFWPHNGYLPATDEPTVVEKWSIQDHELGVAEIADFADLIRNLPIQPQHPALTARQQAILDEPQPPALTATQQAILDEPQPPVLTARQQAILDECDGKLLIVVEIAAAVDCSSRTATKDVNFLVEMGLLHRPQGKRSGFTKKI